MSKIHPNIHPKLRSFSIIHSFHQLVENEEITIEFLEEMDLIPSKDSTPPECCDLPMRVENKADAKLGWIWRCASPRTRGAVMCRRANNPLMGSFFDGAGCRIPLNEVLAIIIFFVMKMKVTQINQHLRQWRESRKGGRRSVSDSTTVDYYNY